MGILQVKGFTLIELILSLMILGIVISISTASYKTLLSEQALTQAARQVYYTLQLAKTNAINRNTKIYVQFCQQQSQWKVGLSESSGCDCFNTGSCQINGVESVYDLADGRRVFINKDDLKFIGGQTSYGALRFSVKTGSITFTNDQQQSLSVIQSAMRLRVCSPDKHYLGYAQC